MRPPPKKKKDAHKSDKSLNLCQKQIVLCSSSPKKSTEAKNCPFWCLPMSYISFAVLVEQPVWFAIPPLSLFSLSLLSWTYALIT